MTGFYNDFEFKNPNPVRSALHPDMVVLKPNRFLNRVVITHRGPLFPGRVIHANTFVVWNPDRFGNRVVIAHALAWNGKYLWIALFSDDKESVCTWWPF